MIILRKDYLVKFYKFQIQILPICQNLHCFDIFNIKTLTLYLNKLVLWVDSNHK